MILTFETLISLALQNKKLFYFRPHLLILAKKFYQTSQKIYADTVFIMRPGSRVAIFLKLISDEDKIVRKMQKS